MPEFKLEAHEDPRKFMARAFFKKKKCSYKQNGKAFGVPNGWMQTGGSRSAAGCNLYSSEDSSDPAHTKFESSSSSEWWRCGVAVVSSSEWIFLFFLFFLSF